MTTNLSPCYSFMIISFESSLHVFALNTYTISCVPTVGIADKIFPMPFFRAEPKRGKSSLTKIYVNGKLSIFLKEIISTIT